MFISLLSETGGERWAELLQNGPVIRTCLSLLTLELFGASDVKSPPPLHTPNHSLAHCVTYLWCAVILGSFVELSNSQISVLSDVK